MPEDILYVRRGLFHPDLFSRRALGRVLRDHRDLAVTGRRRLRWLARLPGSVYRIVVLFFHEKRLPAGCIEGLRLFLEEGGGLLAVHGVSASFKDNPEWEELLGGRFVGHGPITCYRMRPAGSATPVRGDGPFTIRDEMYRHRRSDDIAVEWAAESGEDDGESPEPSVWTRRVGNGRVFYFAPGHRAATFRQPEVARVIERGIDWLLGRDKKPSTTIPGG